MRKEGDQKDVREKEKERERETISRDESRAG